jgi:hypothetical protein
VVDIIRSNPGNPIGDVPRSAVDVGAQSSHGIARLSR